MELWKLLQLQASAVNSPGQGGGEPSLHRGFARRWERAASRLAAITRRICYCGFINEACGSGDWLGHCVNWTVGEKTSQERQSHVQVCAPLSGRL